MKIRQGEAKRILFTLRRSGSVFDISAGRFTFAVKKTYEDTTYSILKRDVVFDKTDAATGRVSFILQAADTVTLAPGKYKGQLRSELDVDDVDISDEIEFEIEATAFHVYTGTSTTTSTTTI